MPRPDLILVDGGKGQLSSAHSVLKELELLEIPIIGLAKKTGRSIFSGEIRAAAHLPPLLRPQIIATIA